MFFETRAYCTAPVLHAWKSIFFKNRSLLPESINTAWIQPNLTRARKMRTQFEVKNILYSLAPKKKKKIAFFDTRAYCMCIIGSAEALPILCVRYIRWERERERYRQTERDGSDVTIVALKLAMNLHFPLPKIRTFRFSLHTSRLSLRGEVTMVAEIRNGFTLSIAKKFFALRLCSPSIKWHEPRDEWSKTQDKWSNPAQSYFSSHRKNESN